MGFRKSVKIAPGTRVNVSKTGGVSVTQSVGKTGIHTRAQIVGGTKEKKKGGCLGPVLVGLLVLGLLGGLGGNKDKPTNQAVETAAPIVAEALATPTSTPEPTPEPTPGPTLEPTPEPTPELTTGLTRNADEMSPEEALEYTARRLAELGGKEYVNPLDEEITVYLNPDSKLYHKPDCGTLKNANLSQLLPFTGTYRELKATGYKPCGNCFR